MFNYSKMFTEHGKDTKLHDILSLSTSPLSNPLCVGRHSIRGAICEKCYSFTYNKMRKPLREKLYKNTEILTTAIIPLELIPRLNVLYFRIESFGDLQNETQAINYLNLIIANPKTNFGWWTKNPGFIKKAMKTLGLVNKPQNVQIVFSSCLINHEIKLETVQRAFPFVDKVFTVYDKHYIAENGTVINCGARDCINCLKCYENNGVAQIAEKLK